MVVTQKCTLLYIQIRTRRDGLLLRKLLHPDPLTLMNPTQLIGNLYQVWSLHLNEPDRKGTHTNRGDSVILRKGLGHKI